MPSRFRSIPQREFAGLNEDENPYAVGQTELTDSLNAWKFGSAKGTRPGAVRDTTDYTAQVTGPVQGIVEYRYGNDANRELVVVAGGDVLTDSTPTSILGGGTVTTGAANTWTFAQHRQRVYAAGGAAGDWFWYWNGTGNITEVGPIVDLSATSIYPRYVFQKWNRLFTAGFRTAAGALLTDASANPMIVRYSALNDGTVWPVANTIGGTSTIGGLSSDGDEFVTGFGEFTDNSGDWLLIFTNKRLYAVTQTGNAAAPFTVSAGRGAIQNGCVHQNAFVSLGLDSGDAVYISAQGIHSLRQSQQYGASESKFLSWKIRRTFESFNQSQLSGAVGAYWRERGLVVFFVPTGSDTQNLLGLALDVKGKTELTAETAEWDVWMLGGATASVRGVNALASGRTSANDYVIFGGNEAGDVFTFNESTTADLGVGYETVIQTKHDDLGVPTTDKGVGDVFITLRGSGTHRPTYRTIFDFGTREGPARRLNLPSAGALWNSATWDVSAWGTENSIGTARVYSLGRGETVAHRISHSGINEPFYVVAINAQVRPYGEIEESV
jgi:hypothetical protein